MFAHVVPRVANVKYDSTIHHRRSIRLREYDYSRPGAYFVTIVTQGRACLFGEISDGQMSLNPAGESIQSWWQRLPDKFPSTTVKSFVVMPNHLHGVLVIDDTGQTHRSAPTGPTETVGADPRVRPDIRDVRTAFPPAPMRQSHKWFNGSKP